MSIVNTYFGHGSRNEQNLLEELLNESIRMYGKDFIYIPRKLVGKDEILGEDRLSSFDGAFPFTAYFENIDSFGGNGFFLSKFGLFAEQSASIVIAKRHWENVVGQYRVTIINRPTEGDLVYFPLTKGLFEIKFVEYQSPFYQLDKMYTYKLQIELFQYASEQLHTGIPEVDVFESLKTHSIDPDESAYGFIKSITITDPGSGYLVPPTVVIRSPTGYGAEAEAIIENGEVFSIIVTNGGINYKSDTIVTLSGESTTQATAIVELEVNIDNVQNYGDNNQFKESFMNLDPNNPFGD